MKPATAVSASCTALSLACLAAAGCGADDPDPGAADAVAQRQRAVCEAMRQGSDPYYGDARARQLAAWLASARVSAEPVDPVAVEAATLAFADELLKLGRTEQALELLTPPAQRPRIPEAPAAEAADPAGDVVPTLAEQLRGGRRGDASDHSPYVRALALRRNAHLQAGEDQNCVLRHSAASCIVPFQPDALHLRPEHARRAGDLSLEILAERPAAVSARWLLNLSRMVSGDYPEGVPEALRLPADAFAPEAAFPRWSDRAPELGVAVVDLAGGAVVDDFDGDGWLDLVSSTSDHCDHLKAFRSDGRGGFEDVTRAWGLDAQLGGLNLVHADFDGDGRLDLLVLRGAWLDAHGELENSLLHNRLEAGGGRFVDVTRAAGLVGAYPTQTAAWADYDADGDLDLYVGNEAWRERAYPSQLFRNEGGGRFTDVAAAAGVENLRFTKGVAWGDYDDDGDPDLYVSNIGENRLYRNEGDGRFTDVARELGVAGPVGRSFATWFFDYDNDGRLDLFVADYGAFAEQVMVSHLGEEVRAGHPVVYRNEGGRFRDVSAELGLARPALPMGANYGDLDNDGWLDVYLGTGNPRFEVLVPNVVLHNREGRAFREVGFASGTAHLQKGHGVAFGDLDNDGDQDLFHQLGGFYPADAYANALFENPGPARRWVTLRLEGRRANRFGVGARIAVRTRGPGGPREVHVLAGSGGSFGGSSLQQEIGLGEADAIEEIRVRWPGSGTQQRFRDVAPDRVYRGREGDERLVPVELPRVRLAGGGGHGTAHPGP